MKILLVNKFLYPKGGDAISTVSTGKLLESKGHKVIFWGMDHSENPDYPHKDLFVPYVDLNAPTGIFQQIKASGNLIYSFEARKKIDKLLKIEKPDIVHLNNFAHQISPSILDVFARYRIPTVMTMRDYKLVCPTYSMLSDRRPCEKCKNGKYYWCFLKKCTKDSYTKSLLNVVEMYLHHKILHIYAKINIFIATSKFLKEKVKEMGLKAEVVYLPNFLNIDTFKPCYKWREKSLVYIGRLSPEKGLFTLLRAIKGLNIKLKIFGDGPIKKDLEEKVRKEKIQSVYFLGHKSQDELKDEVIASMAVVIPSECYETFGLAVIEAFALGKPVVGARIGGIPELVRDGETGLTFEPGNEEDLRKKIKYFTKNPGKIIEMGKNSRKFVEKNFNSENHYKELIKIYKLAMSKYIY